MLIYTQPEPKRRIFHKTFQLQLIIEKKLHIQKPHKDKCQNNELTLNNLGLFKYSSMDLNNGGFLGISKSKYANESIWPNEISFKTIIKKIYENFVK